MKNRTDSSVAVTAGPSGLKRKVLALAVLAVLAGTVAGCGASAGTGVQALPTSMEELVKQAESEGTVAWSAPKPLEQMQPAIDLFEKKYPGIKVNYTNTKAPDQVSQLKMEQAARKVSVDVAAAGELTVPPSLPLAETVDWSAYGIADENIYFEDKFVYIWAAPKVWAYNTGTVSPADLPRSWEDLLKPQWDNGQLAVESRASFLTAWHLDPALGDDKALAWAQQLTGQQPHYTPNTTQSQALVETGQVAAGTSLINLVLQAKSSGSPVEVAPVSPTNTNETFLYVPKGAPHPAAAVLLSTFLNSDDAQAALAETYNSRIPQETDCSNAGAIPVLTSLCAANIEWRSTSTIERYNELADFFPKAQKALGTDLG
ncbi:iron(III) transport system substrate-binding protein [Arthrobacter sp. cf158]|uniref:ABC transporter substrate-binding protein n=1 Tax=Arthrobacter sp. cf158 TaxID=1761744 RepID=UPI000897559C|nr:extracellular solute-binding protein [Arthrobacter sp. cf158]SDW60704.1 iron(III) transport system substrate-binding protein [Arthrobacter sp. cf158]